MNDPRRVAACLKACEGLKTENLEALPVSLGVLVAGSDQQHDELRKAAREVLRMLDGECKDIRSTVEALRAELEKDK